jgi:hypothetical protein
MRHSGFYNHAEAERKMRGARNGRRKLGNNTYLVERDGDYAVRLHDTDVVTIHKDGTYTLDTGGWQTVTTKDRINAFSPARVWSDRGVWYLGGNEKKWAFEDGVRVDGEGKVVSGASAMGEKLGHEKKLQKAIRKYIDGYCKHVVENGLQTPDGGDCWGCYFGLCNIAKEERHEDGLGRHVAPNPDEANPMGYDHLLSHMLFEGHAEEGEEMYFVPSLLWTAMYVRGNRDPAFLAGMIKRDAERGRTDLLKREFQGYFKKIKPKLLGLVSRERVS